MYLCCFKNKQGEVKALQELNNVDQSDFIPLIILQDVEEKALEKLKEIHNGLILLDIRELESEDIIALQDLLENPELNNFKVVHNSKALIKQGSGLPENDEYIKILVKDINEFFLYWLKENNHKLPQNIIIDFGYIGEDNFSTDLERSIELANSITEKNIFILSGAIPSNLSGKAKADENYTLERKEKKLYEEFIQRHNSNNKLIYSDYGTVSPLAMPNPDAPIIPIVQLKYTTNENYIFVRKGQRRGDYKFYEVCKYIVDNINEFDSDLSWGDGEISQINKIQENKGNASTWVSMAMNHHIQYCIKENK